MIRTVAAVGLSLVTLVALYLAVRFRYHKQRTWVKWSTWIAFAMIYDLGLSLLLTKHVVTVDKSQSKELQALFAFMIVFVGAWIPMFVWACGIDAANRHRRLHGL